MQRWSYPIGCILDGAPLAQREVYGPRAFIIGEEQHGPDVFGKWTPQKLASYGIKAFAEDALPVDGNVWPCLPGVPEEVEDELTIRRTYPNATPDEAGWAAHQEQRGWAVRADRNARMASCDWTQLPDAPLSAEGKAAWAAYRQALRDVPEQAGFPLVEWPLAPV